MIKRCPACGHTGELTWRDGKYRCAMCDGEISETEPQVQAQRSTTVSNATCPICRNKENNLFDGSKYRCALCGTPFDLQPEVQEPTFHQFAGVNIPFAQQPRQYAGTKPVATPYIKELQKTKKKNMTWGIVCIFLFWPVSIYFFYQYYKTNKMLNALGF